jgi:GntR family transcriptional regulator
MELGNAPVPLYHVLKETLRLEIRSGLYKPGQLIPPEKELQDRFNVSRTTVRRAIRDLSDEGLLDPQPGRGTYVRSPKLSSVLQRLWGFHEEMAAKGLSPSVQTLSIEKITPDRSLAEKLRVDESEPVWRLVRLQSIDGEPMTLLTTYHLVAHVPGLKQMLESVSNSIYQVLANSGISLSRADEYLEATAIGPRDARLLGVRAGHPGLVIERISYDQRDRIVEYSMRICRGDRYRYAVSLTR